MPSHSRWTDVGGGLPDAPYNAVVADPVSVSKILIGNDVGGVFLNTVGVE